MPCSKTSRPDPKSRKKRNLLVPPDIVHNPTVRGGWVEMQFAADATAQGFTVLRPIALWAAYDFALEYGGGFLRVQVKATSKYTWSVFGADCKRQTRSGRRPYDPSEVDFIAAYVADLRTWYLIPIQDVLAVNSILRLDPSNEARTRKLERFRDGWRRLRRRALRRRPNTRPRTSSAARLASGV